MSTENLKQVPKLLILVIFSYLGFSLSCFPSYGQAPPNQSEIDTATRSVDRSLREEAQAKVAPKEQTPPVIEKKELEETQQVQMFFLKSVHLTGVESLPPDYFNPLIAEYTEKEVSLARLKILAKKIEREYLQKGIIAACIIPPQDIKDGALTMMVIEAKMGRVRIQDAPFFDDDMLYNYWKIDPDEILRYDQMSKDLQLMNKNNDRNVSAALHAGKKPGTTDVYLKVKTQYPFHVYATYDKEGSPSTGRDRRGIGVRHNNFLFVDDTFLAGYTYGQFFSGYYMYHVVPITNFGTSIMYGYSDSRSAPRKDYSSFGIRSRSQNTSVYLTQDIFDKSDYVGEVSLGIDGNDKVTKTEAGTLNRDRLRIARLKSTYIHKYPGTITYITPQISQGLATLGARKNNPLSSRGINRDFTKFNLAMKHTRLLPMDLKASINLKWQVASERLPSQEEFALGGMNSVRGYPNQDYMADTGYQLNCELLIPAFFVPEDFILPYAESPMKDDIELLVFLDHAYGEKRGALLTGERDNVRYAGIGGGFRMRLFNQVLLRLEWGVPIGFDKGLTETPNPRFHFSLNFEDNFPEEFQKFIGRLDTAHYARVGWKLVDAAVNKKDSPLGAKIAQISKETKIAQENKDYMKEKLLHRDMGSLGRNLFTQGERYAKACYDHKKRLNDIADAAEKEYKSSNYEKAKSLWEKVVNESQIEPLILVVEDKTQTTLSIDDISELMPSYSRSLNYLIKKSQKNLEKVTKIINKYQDQLTKENEIRALYNKAMDLFDAGKIEESKIIWEEMLEKSSTKEMAQYTSQTSGRLKLFSK